MIAGFNYPKNFDFFFRKCKQISFLSILIACVDDFPQI